MMGLCNVCANLSRSSFIKILSLFGNSFQNDIPLVANIGIIYTHHTLFWFEQKIMDQIVCMCVCMFAVKGFDILSVRWNLTSECQPMFSLDYSSHNEPTHNASGPCSMV